MSRSLIIIYHDGTSEEKPVVEIPDEEGLSLIKALNAARQNPSRPIKRIDLKSTLLAEDKALKL